MSKKLSKSEAKEEIENFFENIKDKKPREIKKIKKLAMRNSIKLKDKKKLFCKKCHNVFNSNNSKTRIIKGNKVVTCIDCKNVTRSKLK